MALPCGNKTNCTAEHTVFLNVGYRLYKNTIQTGLDKEITSLKKERTCAAGFMGRIVHNVSVVF